MPQSIVLKDLTVTKRTLNLEKALLYLFLFLQTTFFYYFLFMFVIVCYGACLAFLKVFSCFLWVVLFPLVLCPTCNLSICTFCCFYMTSFFKKFFFFIIRISFNQLNLTILNTELIEYIYCGCFLFHFPFDVVIILCSMSFHFFTQTFTSASNIHLLCPTSVML